MNSLIKKMFPLMILSLGLLFTVSCANTQNTEKEFKSVRPQKDTIGFAQYPWQMDSLMARIDRKGWNKTIGDPWKMAICPHDDYTYVGKLFPEILHNVKAPNVILIGVAHRAAAMGIEDSLVFDTYTHWQGPWKDVKVSPIREELYDLLKGKFAMINDSLQKVEHSVESMVPYLQYFNRDVSIVSILVPAMSLNRMEESGKALAEAIKTVADKHNWKWGKDYAIVVTTDADHYGNEDWGGFDRAPFGCDDAGNQKARDLEAEIIENCLKGEVNPENIKRFSEYTLDANDFHQYIWYWCGRYSVPTTLWTTYYLNNAQTLHGEFIGYATSITCEHIPVDDLGFGRTAIATPCHWVGYAALGYR
ncbi:MAG: AmmeMemoRadiSam system protein B [Bacteroidetes bacterium]|nr:AmmeMemoRadiSam system protein B [Bacteroidota bacterium]